MSGDSRTTASYVALILAALLAPMSSTANPLFEDVSANLPPHIYSGDWNHFVGGGLAILDCNNDGIADVFAAGGETPALLLRNDGRMRFSPQPIPQIIGTTGAYPIDVNGDGHMDLFVLRVGPNMILKGDGQCGFVDASAEFNLSTDDSWSTAFTAWWEDELPTMAIGNYVNRSDPNGPFEACDDNQILTPRERNYVASPLTPGYCPLSILAAQDARGRHTLRLSNDRHYYVRGGFEQMWDTTERRFLGPEDGWQNVSLWGMGIASRDLNGDGRDEVMLTSMGDQLLQIAQSDGTYKAADYAIGTYAQRPHVGDDGRPSTGWHAEFADVDNDGRADLFIAKGNVDQMPGMATRDPNNLLMQLNDGKFEERALTASVATTERSRGAALVDFDNDGRLDLIVSNRRAPLELYRNVTAGTGNWINITLRQSGGNADAIGALISVDTGPSIQLQQHTIGGGHAGGQLVGRHFGLAEAEQIEVSVTWPDKSQSTHSFTANQRVVISKPTQP